MIAFLSDRRHPETGKAGKANLYVMRVDGGEPWALTAYEETAIADVRWAPDGSRLAFRMDEPPTDEKRRAREAKDDAVLWDEDFDFRHVYSVPFAEMPRILPEVTQLTGGRMHVTQLAWLPDGASLALTVQPTPKADDWTATRLVRVPATLPEAGPWGPDGVEEIAPIHTRGEALVVSPDGTWIACVTGDTPPRWAGSDRIVLYPVAGGDARPLAYTPDAQSWPVGWSPDGKTIYAMAYAGVDTHIWALPATGEAGELALDSGTYKFAFSRMQCGVTAFAAETFEQPNRLMAWRPEQPPAFVAAPPLPEDWPVARMPEVEVLHWEGPGGMPVEGYVIYPLDHETGERCPLVVHVHGGPSGVFLRRYLAWPDRQCDMLTLAEQGVAVLRVNPRGSSGYGRDFRFANYGDWGGGDFGDIMAGVDLLIDRGLADPDRLGIMGWSYGGYMTSWAITQTDRFKAACVGAGVTNLMSFTGTADIPGFLPDYFGGEAWDDLPTYLEHSALANVAGVTTPTLVQHGDADVRVPLGQGREFYNALKRQGVEARMVIYPRQGHGVNEPRLRIDVRRRAAHWMIEHLTDV